MTWTDARLVVAADLGDGRSDPRPQAPDLIGWAVAALPDGLQAPIVRADSGFFDAKVAHAAIAQGCDFAIVAKRSVATWAAVRKVPNDAWQPAHAMTGAEVAYCRYLPAGWPPGTRCVVRRVRLDAEDISVDGRSRRRRTIDADQLALALTGTAGHAYAYSFICTNLDWHAVAAEWWFRQRALIEERIRDTKLGVALRHLPSGYQAVNHTWMWAAIFALNISGWLQILTRTDLTVDGRAHAKRLRRELICLAARVDTPFADASCCGSRPASAKDSSCEPGESSGRSPPTRQPPPPADRPPPPASATTPAPQNPAHPALAVASTRPENRHP